MSRYIDAERLKAEIEKRLSIFEKGIAYDCWASCKKIVESLQQEQPQVADASKMERLNVAILRDWSMKFAPNIRYAIEATAYHFWDLAIYSIKEK